MPAGALRGLHGLYGEGKSHQDLPQHLDQGVLEARAAPGTATSHGKYGSQSLGYGGPVPKESSGTMIQPVYDAGTDGEVYADWDFPNSGETYLDKTPDVHGAPYPRGIVETRHGGHSLNTPAGLEVAGEQMRVLHGLDFGGQKLYVAHDPAERQTVTRYTTDRYPAPNENMLNPKVPNQMRPVAGTFGGGGQAGMGQADTTQGYGKLNDNWEFQRGHSVRRIQHDRMPWDFTNTHGEQDVLFLGRHEVRQRRLDGPDSPYFEAGDIGGQHVPWEGRIGFPREYIQPPNPHTVPSNQSLESEDLWGW
jgi:hypothetical protein